MATLWEKIRHYANEKVKREYMDKVRHDRKCPNCKMWTSEVGGCCSIDYSDDDHIEIMKCRQCGYKSKWDCRGMIPTIHDQQDSHTHQKETNMSDLKRFDMNGNTHINGRYCDANEAMELIKQQAAEIDALKAHVEQLRDALRHLHHNAKASGAEMGLALDVAEETLESTPQQNLAEQHPDDEAVNKFAYQMKCKLAIARSKGRSGWDNPDLCTVESLVDMLVEHLQKPNAGNWIDITNFCMMLHLRGANPWLLVNALAEHDAEVARKAYVRGYVDASQLL